VGEFYGHRFIAWSRASIDGSCVFSSAPLRLRLWWAPGLPRPCPTRTPPTYDHATDCKKHPQPGTVALQHWLEQNAAGVSWGIMRCEKWGKNSASLHAEGRALDWHLDSRSRRQARAANRLIDLLLATDRRGNEHALARRMGIQEIIWNCHSWWSGSDGMGKYSQCFNEKGKRLRNVDFTQAHKDHIHFGLSWRGAKKRTTFWSH
jgi:hypothetical protein